MWILDLEYFFLKIFVYKYGGFVKIVGFFYYFRKMGIVEGKFDRVLYLCFFFICVLYGNCFNYFG